MNALKTLRKCGIPKTGKIKLDASKIPHVPRFLSLSSFAEKYDIDASNILVFHANRLREGGHPFTASFEGRVIVNEGYYLAFKDFTSTLRNYAHELYYELSERYGLSDRAMAEKIAKRSGRKVDVVAHFVSKDLFSIKEDGRIRFEVSSLLVEFTVYGTRIAEILEER